MTCIAVMPDGLRCGWEAKDGIHQVPCPYGCPGHHHPYTEEPMPEHAVTIATVHDAHTGYRHGIPGKPDGYYSRVVLDWPDGVPLPRNGDRVAVAGSVDNIFGWMESLPAARVIEAAKAWAAMVDKFRGVSQQDQMGEKARALYDAVKALGEAPSGGFDPGRETGDRTATVITITIERSA